MYVSIGLPRACSLVERRFLVPSAVELSRCLSRVVIVEHKILISFGRRAARGPLESFAPPLAAYQRLRYHAQADDIRVQCCLVGVRKVRALEGGSRSIRGNAQGRSRARCLQVTLRNAVGHTKDERPIESMRSKDGIN